MKILVIGDFQGVFSDKLKRKLKKVDYDLVIGVGDYGGIKDWMPHVMKRLKAAKEGEKLKDIMEFMGKKRYMDLLKKDFTYSKKVYTELNKLGNRKKVLYVFGNGDDGWYRYPFSAKDLWPVDKKNLKALKRLKNLKDFTYGKAKFNGVTFVGFGGYMDIDSYFNVKEFKDAKDKERLMIRIKRHTWTKRNFFSRLNKLSKKERQNLVFVFHYPPKGVFDIIKSKGNPMDGKSAGISFFNEAIKKYKPKFVLCGHMHEYKGMKNVPGTNIPVINPGDAEKDKFAVVEIDDNFKVKKVKFY